MNKKLIIPVVVAVLIVTMFYWSGGFSDGKMVPLEPSEVVELKDGDTYDLTASYVKKEINGQTYKMLAYNGSIPGPLIKVPQGGEVTINFKNNTDLDTTVHSHGVRLDNQFDGVPDVTQPAIKPGATFVYKLKFPDAGMFWYHPHVREDLQQELGLYGNYLVAPQEADYWSPVNREAPLFIDDILIEGGQINLSKTGADHTLMGRYGNVMLVNGETDYSLAAKKGEVIRFYITNSANARPFNLAINGAKMKLVGGDSGAYEKDQWVSGVTLGPSERAVVEVLFDQSGIFALENNTPNKTTKLGVINVSTEEVEKSYALEFAQLRTHTAAVKSIDHFRSYFSKEPDKQLALTIDMGGHMGHSMMNTSPDGIEWEDNNQMMNQMSDTSNIDWSLVDQATGKKDMDIDWVFKKGEPVKIRIFNDPKSTPARTTDIVQSGGHPMQHPIHFHGQRFLVVSRDGVAQTNLVWKDTVLIPSGQTVDILLDTSNPGTWMAHCHIAEHLEAGMMFNFKVE